MDAAGRDPVLAAPMSMAVHGEVGAGPIDGLREQIGAEEGVDLGRLAHERVADRRVMHQRDAHVRHERPQRLLERVRALLRVADERLHLPLAELGPRTAREPASEPLHAGHADGARGRVDHHGVALQDDRSDVPQDRRDLRLSIQMVVVVAEHRHHLNAEPLQLARQRPGLLGIAGLRQVPGDQQHVGAIGNGRELLAERRGRVWAHVHVPDGGHPDHRTRSAPSASG